MRIVKIEKLKDSKACVFDVLILELDKQTETKKENCMKIVNINQWAFLP